MKTTQLKTMTPEAQRIAIAEACGWRHIRPLGDPMENRSVCFTNEPNDYPPENFTEETMVGLHPENCEGARLCEVPNYPADLNAIHEAWKTVIEPDALLSLRYYQNLCGLIENNPDGTVRFGVCFFNEVTNATAAQRTEAFLRTIGKWVSST